MNAQPLTRHQRDAMPPAWVVDGAVVTGAQLMRRGLQPPALYAESVLLVEFTREG